MALADNLLGIMTEDFIHALYRRYQGDTVIKFKDSIKEIVGLERPVVKGLDI